MFCIPNETLPILFLPSTRLLTLNKSINAKFGAISNVLAIGNGHPLLFTVLFNGEGVFKHRSSLWSETPSLSLSTIFCTTIRVKLSVALRNPSLAVIDIVAEPVLPERGVAVIVLFDPEPDTTTLAVGIRE